MLQMSIDSNAVSTLLNLGEVVAIIFTLVISLSGAYYALGFRRILVDKLERNRALWTGTLALLLATVVLVLFFSPENSPAFPLVAIAFIIVVAGWLDSAIRTAIEQDYFHRNTLLWKRLRFVFWAGILGNFIVTPILVFANVATPGFFGLATILVGGSALLYGTLTLFVSGQRTKDRKMKSYLRWIGLSVAFLLALLTSGLVLSFSNILPLVPIILLAFSLYRAARSLAPTSKIETGLSRAVKN